MVASQISARSAQPSIGKPWQKGQSGNPGGRPKIAADIKAEARMHTKEALDRLVHWMRSDDSQASIRAATALLDRGCGKPTQAITGEGAGLLVLSFTQILGEIDGSKTERFN